MDGRTKVLVGAGTAVLAAGVGLMVLLREPLGEDVDAPEGAEAETAGTPRGAGGAPPGTPPGPRPAPALRAQVPRPRIDVEAMAAADPRELGVHAQVVRGLDQLAAPVAIRTVRCEGASCEVVLEAKSREDAAVLIDRLSEPGSGFAGEATSMMLHAVRDEDGLTVFGFTLSY